MFRIARKKQQQLHLAAGIECVLIYVFYFTRNSQSTLQRKKLKMKPKNANRKIIVFNCAHLSFSLHFFCTSSRTKIFLLSFLAQPRFFFSQIHTIVILHSFEWKLLLLFIFSMCVTIICVSFFPIFVLFSRFTHVFFCSLLSTEVLVCIRRARSL